MLCPQSRILVTCSLQLKFKGKSGYFLPLQTEDLKVTGTGRPCRSSDIRQTLRARKEGGDSFSLHRDHILRSIFYCIYGFLCNFSWSSHKISCKCSVRDPDLCWRGIFPYRYVRIPSGCRTAWGNGRPKDHPRKRWKRYGHNPEEVAQQEKCNEWIQGLCDIPSTSCVHKVNDVPPGQYKDRILGGKVSCMDVHRCKEDSDTVSYT